MLRWLLILGYVTSPVYINWVYMHVAEPVNDTGERLLMLSPGVGIDPTLPIIGATLCLRDWVQATWGRTVSVGAIVVGAGISALVSPEVALASGVAFLASELADQGVWTVLARRPAIAVAASGLVGAAVDTTTFLLVAFGTMDTWGVQWVGKAVTILLVAAAMQVWRSRRTVAIA
jgi:hypothetical protein